MDEAAIPVAIEYDVKGGRVVLSEMEEAVVKILKKKLEDMKKVTLQVHEEGFIVSPNGVYFTADDPAEHRIGVA